MMELKKVGFAGAAFLSIFVIAGARTSGQLQQRPADEYLKAMDNPDRDLKVDEVISKLRLKPGNIVADIGSGSGSFSIPMAKAIAPNGTLYAVDIDQKMLDFVADKAKKAGVTNLRTVLGEFDDPKLPARDVDLAFINDVLHHIQNRAVYLKALAHYIKPSGRIAIIEMNKDDPKTPHRNQPELLVSRDEITSWMADAGFKLVEEHADLFPGTRWYLIFGHR